MRDSHRLNVAILFAAIAFFWAIPMLGPRATIQWDALTYFYPYQKHFSDSVRAGRLPFWTAQIFSGFPFLADLQTGSWYPLNWPFFLYGIHPKSLFGEECLHTLLAGLGAYLLCFRLLADRQAAQLGAILFALCGFQIAHAEHVALFQAAAWLPLAIWSVIWASDKPSSRRLSICGLIGGCLGLTGHFQLVLYVLCAVWITAIYSARRQPRQWRSAVIPPLIMCVSVPLLGAIQILPSVELLHESLRSHLVAETNTSGIAGWLTLATLVYPKASGTLDAAYHNTAIDISQGYFYDGCFLMPLALVGLADRRVRTLALLLIVPALAYALGPIAGVYYLLVHVPGFSSVRSPVHAMIVVTLGLILLAAAGALRLRDMWKWRWTVPLLCVVVFADLFFWNMLCSTTVYERKTQQERLVLSERWYRELLQLPVPLGQRVGAPGRWAYFYPAMAPFDLPVETTVGENAFLLTRYYDFEVAMTSNRRLMDELSISRYFDLPGWTVYDNPHPLPRFTFPANIARPVAETELLRDLLTLDPASTGLLEPATPLPDVYGSLNGGRYTVVNSTEDSYELSTTCSQPCVMRISIPYYSGWQAELDGEKLKLFPMDRALTGAALPPGDHHLRLWFVSRYFRRGAAISIVTLAVLLLIIA